MSNKVKLKKTYTEIISVVCCRPFDCLVILPFGDDVVAPLTYASDEQFDIVKRVI